MAEKEYRIVITNETTDKESAPISTIGDANSQARKPDNARAVNAESSSSFAMALTATNQIRSYIDQAIGMQLSQVAFQTGSQTLQMRANAFSSFAGNGLSLGITAIERGAEAAAKGAAGALISFAVSTIQNMISIQNAKQMENESLGLKKSRIGYATNRSRGGAT